jgi:excisionase family DNA binding protein
MVKQARALSREGRGATTAGGSPVPLSERITLTVDEFAERTGIACATAWRRVRDGSVRVVRLGRRTLVPASEVRRIADGVPPEARR